MKKLIQKPLSSLDRVGAVLPLIAILMCVMFAMTAISLDIAYIELVRTELRAATDAAARAAASALVQGETTAQVQTVAIDTAALNKVAGKPLVINGSDVEMGQTILQSDGTYLFQAGLQPYEAVQVTGNLGTGTPLFFSPVFGVKSYSPTNVSVAAASACDVCLVLDRSHSMCWDESGTSWVYPSPYGKDTFGVLNTVTLAPSGLPSGVFQQHPPTAGSRWLALQTAVDSFCNVLTTNGGNTKAAVVTWASTVQAQMVYSTIQAPFQLPASTGVTLDVALTNNMSAIQTAVATRSNEILLGGTDMYTGIKAGIQTLTGAGSRPIASKVMILMTDGDWSSPAGNADPAQAGNDAAAQGIVVHCISFLANANQTTCQSIATTTGGKFYYATDAASLQATFETIARTLPVSLTH